MLNILARGIVSGEKSENPQGSVRDFGAPLFSCKAGGVFRRPNGRLAANAASSGIKAV